MSHTELSPRERFYATHKVKCLTPEWEEFEDFSELDPKQYEIPLTSNVKLPTTETCLAAPLEISGEQVSERPDLSSVTEESILSFFPEDNGYQYELRECLEDPRIYMAKYSSFFESHLSQIFSIITRRAIESREDLVKWWDKYSPKSNLM